MLNAIDLAGVPIHQADRTDDDPIVLIGGHAAFNPEPVADFIDAAVLGMVKRHAWRFPGLFGTGRRPAAPVVVKACL